MRPHVNPLTAPPSLTWKHLWKPWQGWCFNLMSCMFPTLFSFFSQHIIGWTYRKTGEANQKEGRLSPVLLWSLGKHLRSLPSFSVPQPWYSHTHRQAIWACYRYEHRWFGDSRGLKTSFLGDHYIGRLLDILISSHNWLILLTQLNVKSI